MIRGCWHSITYDGDMADVESMVAENGMAFVFNVKDWYHHDGGKVFVGKHLVTDDERKLARMITDLRKLRITTNSDPSGRFVDVLVDRCHT